MDRLSEIRQRTEATTPGPWDSKTSRHPECNGEPWGWISGASGNITWSGSAGKANADFIAHSRDDIPYLLSEVAELTELLNASKAGQLTLQKAWEQDKDELTARAEAAEAERDAAVEDMTAVLKRDSDDICAYCKNRIECKNEQCEKYSSGVGDVDGNYPDWKWTCMDFDYGACSLLADTPCNGCFDDDYKGFEWRGPQEAER